MVKSLIRNCLLAFFITPLWCANTLAQVRIERPQRDQTNANIMGTIGLERSPYQFVQRELQQSGNQKGEQVDLEALRKQASVLAESNRISTPIELAVSQGGDQLISNGMLLYKAEMNGQNVALMAFPSHGIPVRDKASVEISVSSPGEDRDEPLAAEVVFDNPGEDIVIVAVPYKEDSWLAKAKSSNLWNLEEGSLPKSYKAPELELSETMRLKAGEQNSPELQNVGIEMRCLDDGKVVDLTDKFKGDEAKIRLSAKDLNPPLLKWAYEVNLPVKHGMSGCPVYWKETNQFIGMLFQHGVGTQNAFIVPADVVRASFCEGLKRTLISKVTQPKAETDLNEANALGCSEIASRLGLHPSSLNDLSLESSEKLASGSKEIPKATTWSSVRASGDGVSRWNTNSINAPERVFIFPKNENREQEITIKEPSSKFSFLVTKKKPGDVTGKRPGDVTTKRPGDVTTKRPGDVTTKRPGDVTTKRPGDVTTKRPGDVANDEDNHSGSYNEDGVEIQIKDQDGECKFVFISPYDDMRDIGNINELLRNYYSGGHWLQRPNSDVEIARELATSSSQIRMNSEIFSKVFGSNYHLENDFRSGLYKFSPLTEKEYNDGTNDFDNFALEKGIKTTIEEVKSSKNTATWVLSTQSGKEVLNYEFTEGVVTLSSINEKGEKEDWLPIGAGTKEIRNFVFYNPLTKKYLELSHTNEGASKSMRVIRSHYRPEDGGTLVRESLLLRSAE